MPDDGGVRPDDGGVRYESVFRENWRDRRSASTRPGELIKQPKWIDAGLLALGVVLAAGVASAGTVTVAQTDALSAVAQGTSVTAERVDGSAPARGDCLLYTSDAADE